MPSQVVLITGVAGYWGRQLALRLAAEPLHLLGLHAGDVPPPSTPPDIEFIRADVRDPSLVQQLRAGGVNTVCHLQFHASVPRSERLFQENVMGTMRLLGACAEAGVERVILKSSTAVYGAHADNSAFLTEAHPLRGSCRYGYLRDWLEIENFCDAFEDQAPHLTLIRLRFSSIAGPTADTPMTRFLKSHQAPVLLGFDPMMQAIHEQDVVEALAHTVLHPAAGTFNVAARDPLPLSRLLGLAGKPPLPVLHLLAYRVPRALRPTLFPIPPDYLRYPWVGDLTRMQETLQFQPHYSAPDALRSLTPVERVQRDAPATETFRDNPGGRAAPGQEETEPHG